MINFRFVFNISVKMSIIAGVNFGNLGCSTSNTSNINNHRGAIHPAAFAADGLTFERPRKEREKNDFEFYYKKCAVAEEVPPPVWRVWECTSP